MPEFARPLAIIEETEERIDIRIEDNLRVIKETKTKIMKGNIEFDMIFMAEIFDQYDQLARAFGLLESAFLDFNGTEREQGQWLSLTKNEVAIVDIKTSLDN